MRPLLKKNHLNVLGSKNTNEIALHLLKPAQEAWTTACILDSIVESKKVYQTTLGVLYEGDCTKLLPAVIDESIDTIFADPPFNLSKKYGKKVNDDRPDNEYIQWSKQWLDECIRAC